MAAQSAQASQKTTEKDELNRFQDDLATMRADVARLTESLKDLAGAQGAAVRDQVRKGAKQAEDGAKKAAAAAAQEVEQRPLASLAVAFGVGLLAGLSLRRRS